MPVRSQGTGEEGSHKRGPHKKSRRGCRNCKLRKIKCDETRPKCKKCTTFGVSCNYDPNTPDLQMTFGGSFTIKAPQKSPCLSNQALFAKMSLLASLHPAIIPDNNSVLQLDRQSLDRLTRFQMRTVLSIGTARAARLYQTETVRLACANPYLMHVVQALTAIHDRYLSLSSDPGQIFYHLSRAAALFNQKLSAPIQPHERDALWATAVLLGIIALSSIEASTPEEAWPLKRSDPFDLEWIRMSGNKKAICNIANPLRPDSVFRALAEDYRTGIMLFAPSSPGIEGIPSAFIQLYGLDSSSTAKNSPYFVALHELAPLLHMKCEMPTMWPFLSFISHMPPDFMRLLQRKEPRALLLLTYWYAMVCQSVWWIERRATMECQATCLYLERYHADDTAIQGLLRFPKMRCGLVRPQVGLVLVSGA